MIGGKRQKEFLTALGLMERVPLEIVEARGSTPLTPLNWSEISTMTISYGHGISVSPLASGCRLRSDCQWRNES